MELSVFFNHVVVAAEQSGLSLEDTAQKCLSWGITGLEIMNTELQQPGTQEKLAVLCRAGMHVNSMPAFCDFGHCPNEEEARRVIDLAVSIGSDKVLAIPGFITEQEKESREAMLQNMVCVLRSMCEYAGQKGVTVGMEDFDGKEAPFSTMEGLLWFMEQVPGLSCFFDTGNFLYSEQDAWQAYTKLKKYIRHEIHCKDRGEQDRGGEKPKITLSGRPMYPAPAGSGVIPLRDILTDLLTTTDFDGSLAIEHFDSCRCLQDMEESARWLNQLLREVR